MPQLPVYDAPQVRREALAPPTMSAEDFGSHAGRELAHAGGQVQQSAEQLSAVAQRIQEREDADQAFRRQTAMESDWLEYSQQLQKRRGVNAKGVINDVDVWWSEAQKKYEDGLNANQRAILAKSAARVRSNAVQTFYKFQEAETERSLDESTAASKAMSISNAAQNPTTENIAATVEELRTKNAYTGARKGWLPEQVAEAQLQDTTTLHANVINGMIGSQAPGSAQAAQAYFERHHNDIDGKQHDDIKPRIEKAVVDEKAMEIATALTGAPLDVALEKIGGIEDPALRKAARTHYMNNKRDEDLIRTARQDAAEDNVKKALAQGRRPNPNDVGAMSGTGQLWLRKQYEARARAVAVRPSGGGAPRLHAKQDNYEALDEVEAMIERGDIKTAEQLLPYAPFLKETTYRSLRRSAAAAGTIKATEVDKAFMESGGFASKAKMSDNQRQSLVKFRDFVNDTVKETRRPGDLQALADQWFMKGSGEKDSFWRADPGTFGEARTKGRDDFNIKTPKERQVDVDSALKKFQRVMPPDERGGKINRDQFYTKYQLPAERYIRARGMTPTPDAVAAVAARMSAGKPLTPLGLDQTIEQVRKLTK